MLPEQAELLARMEAKRYSIFCLIHGSKGPVRCWTGVGDFDLPADAVDVEGGRYLGIGLLGEIPAIRSLIGGTAERVEFSLSGADPLTVALADENADEVIGAPVNLGIVFFDREWRATPISWVWSGIADVPSINQDATGTQIFRQVTLSVVTAFANRTRPVLAYYTDADQRKRSPTDAFCRRVAGYSIDSTIKFPA